MSANTKSLGLTIGAAIGKGAAYAVHGAISTAQASGRFGADLAAGAQSGYADKAAELAAKREALLAQIEASETATVKRQPRLAAPAPAKTRRAKAAA